jgi:hypothetical protein
MNEYVITLTDGRKITWHATCIKAARAGAERQGYQIKRIRIRREVR